MFFTDEELEYMQEIFSNELNEINKEIERRKDRKYKLNLARHFNEKLGGKLYGEKFQVEKWY